MAGRHTSANATVSSWDAFEVTPSNSTVFAATRGLYVGTAGDINVKMAGSESNVIFTNVSGWLPLQVVQVRATGTTATGIVGLY